MTVIPVLAGFAPAITLTVRRVVPERATVFGVAVPEPVGGVETAPLAGARATPRKAVPVAARTGLPKAPVSAPVGLLSVIRTKAVPVAP